MIEDEKPVLLSCEDNESLVLGEESIDRKDPDSGKYKGWQIAQDGKPHPRTCPICGTLTLRTPIEGFHLHNQGFDLSVTCDGYYVQSVKFERCISELFGCSLGIEIPGEQNYQILDTNRLPVLEVDERASQIRRGSQCSQCNESEYILFGRVPGRPPQILELVFNSSPSKGQLYRTDLRLGTTHGRSHILVVHPDDWEELKNLGLCGLSARKGLVTSILDSGA